MTQTHRDRSGTHIDQTAPVSQPYARYRAYWRRPGKERVLSFKRALLAAFLTSAVIFGSTLPAQAATVVKATDSLTFRPAVVTIHRGQKVVWKNVASISHTVTSTSSNWSKNVDLHPGDTTSHTFKKRGTYKYKCRFHVTSGMTGK